jgi:hypothetical protein
MKKNEDVDAQSLNGEKQRYQTLSGMTVVYSDYGEPFEVDIELRKNYDGSGFMPEEFDETIAGVNPDTKSIIYNVWLAGFRYLEIAEGILPDWADTIYGCHRFISWFNNIDFGDKVQPSLMLPIEGRARQAWNDIVDEEVYYNHIFGNNDQRCGENPNAA